MDRPGGQGGVRVVNALGRSEPVKSVVWRLRYFDPRIAELYKFYFLPENLCPPEL